jgi:hypothetical protein
MKFADDIKLLGKNVINAANQILAVTSRSRFYFTCYCSSILYTLEGLKQLFVSNKKPILDNIILVFNLF